MSNGNCWNCGQSLEENDYTRKEVCPQCGKDTRSCKNCEHHDPSCHNECKENQADRIVEKEKSNFCDYFRPGTHRASECQSKDELKSVAESLFKK